MSSAARRVVILGATSAIAAAAARLWAKDGARLVLVGRKAERLKAIADDVTARGAGAAKVVVLDCATADAEAELTSIADGLGGLDIVLIAYGVLGDPRTLETSPEAAADLLRCNFTSAAAWCLAAARILEMQRAGTLLVIGSVAGDRGRRSNYVYGASKAGLGVLVQGLAHRLAGTGARTVLIKPGFVDTPMTAHITGWGPLWASPERLGAIIVRAGERGGPVVYAPWFWRPILLAARLLPAALFHRTRL
ncbi:MAG: SDR family NAD(P)-dependent oxidoreductase [Ancalomicrobiaceae bacterium]|nr:SDR family NAD(P)-dependent oxidoreductase [Ancalomicrobiaceae bacterium]